MTSRLVIRSIVIWSELARPDRRSLPFLRHPVDRFLSAVAHARSLAKDVFSDPAITLMRTAKISAILESPYSTANLRMFSHMLSPASASNVSARAASRAAFEVLRDRITTFGLVGRMQESMERLADALALPEIPRVGLENVSPGRDALESERLRA